MGSTSSNPVDSKGPQEDNLERASPSSHSIGGHDAVPPSRPSAPSHAVSEDEQSCAAEASLRHPSLGDHPAAVLHPQPSSRCTPSQALESIHASSISRPSSPSSSPSSPSHADPPPNAPSSPSPGSRQPSSGSPPLTGPSPSGPSRSHSGQPPSHRPHRRPRPCKHSDAEILSFTKVHSLTFQHHVEPAPALPTSDWACLDLSGRGHILRLSLQHGRLLPLLEVRSLHNSWRPAGHPQLDECLRWLLGDLDKARPMLGLDAEGGSKSISLIQISTARRCLLLRMPPYEEQKKKGVGFSAAFRRMMEDRRILKGGAELWNDVLEMWGSCQQLATNGCVNVTLLHRDDNGESDSLEDMCENVVGHDSFRKDRQTTCSAWDAPALTLRQVVYAAVDAQTSYMLAARTPSLPPLLHLASLPAHWLDRASHWRWLKRLEDKEVEKELEVAFKTVTFGEHVMVHMQQYTSRIRNRSNVTFYWKDGSSNEMTVLNVDGKVASVIFTGGGDRRSAGRRQEHLDRIQLNRADEHDIYAWPQDKYISGFMHGETPSPFHAALLNLPFPAPSSEALAPGSLNAWWWANAMPHNPPDYVVDESFAPLNPSQKAALKLSDHHRVTIVQGPPGTGKTRTIAAEAIRSLNRVGKGEASQRVLCLAETNTAARHMCDAISSFLPPEELQLLVSEEFEHDWHSELYDDLVRDGYMEQLNWSRAQRKRPSRATKPPEVDPWVLVATVGKCIGARDPRKYQRRATLILDEASQVYDLRAIILLRALPDTERLLMFGDDKQLAPYVAREEAHSVLDLANEAIKNHQPDLPRPFIAARMMLNVQYRMPPTLGHIISTVFYQGKLSNFKTTEERPCVQWIQAAGKGVQEGTSVYNQGEIKQVLNLWHSLQKPPFNHSRDDVVVICFYEAQRKKISIACPTARVHNVDSFQGQEAPVVLLTLSASFFSAFLRDPRRVNVACSRAQQKLFIIGRGDLARKEPANQCWRQIEALCQQAQQTAASTSPSPSSSSSPRPCPAPSSPPAVHSSPSVLEEMLRRLLSASPVPMSLTSLGDAFIAEHGCSFRNRSAAALGPFVGQRPQLFKVQTVSSSSGSAVSLAAPLPAIPAQSVSALFPDTLVEESLCAILHRSNVPLHVAQIGHAFTQEHKQRFRNACHTSLESFLRQRPLLFTLYRDSSTPLVRLTSPSAHPRPTQSSPTTSLPNDLAVGALTAEPSLQSSTALLPLAVLPDARLEEILCTILNRASAPLISTSLGLAFRHQHGQSFRHSSRASLEAFVRQRPLVFTVYKDPSGSNLLVCLAPSSLPLSSSRPPPVPVPTTTSPPPPYSEVIIEEILVSIVSQAGSAGLTHVQLGSAVGTRLGGAEFRSMAKCTMKRFLQLRPALFRLEEVGVSTAVLRVYAVEGAAPDVP